MMTEVYTYDDFAVGQVLHSPRSLVIDCARIIAFGEEFDPQPAHLSEALAAKSQFGELVASGWHTGCVSMRLATETYRIADGGMGAGIEKMNWLRPVKPGDALRVEVTILAMRPSRSRPDRGLLTIHTRTLNQHDVAVMEMTANVLAPRRAAEVG
ncbi:MAG: MaoC family dehydratase [Acetobacteraceae bacterium]|nr:MaoC family dehydratase [Acetobacteraceae bacterium]